MGLVASITRFLAGRQTQEPKEPEQSRIAWQGRTLAGVYVSPDNALTNPVVWACVRYLTSVAGPLPWHVRRELPGGGSEIVSRHPTDLVLSWRTNPELSPFQFKETLIAWALLWGNGYAEIVRDGAGRVVQMWPLHPSRVEVRRNPDTGELYYRVNRVNGDGPTVDLAPMDVFHLRGFGDGPVGLSVVDYAAQTIGWAQATELFGASFFGNGLNTGGVIEGASGLDAAGLARLKLELKKMFGGPRNANKWVILDNGMKWVRTSAAPNEAQMIETMSFQVEAICRWFGVPPHKVAHLLRSTNNNIESQSIEVVVDAVTPWITRLEEEANYKLFGQNRMGLYTEIDMRKLLRGDSKARAEYYRAMSDLGAYSPNMILRDEGENPIPYGDKHTIQVNRTTLERVGEDPAQQTGDSGANSADAVPVPDLNQDTTTLQNMLAMLDQGVTADAAD